MCVVFLKNIVYNKGESILILIYPIIVYDNSKKSVW